MGYIYIYRSGEGNVFKIGKASDFDKRVRTLATGNPEQLTQFDLIETDHASQCETTDSLEAQPSRARHVRDECPKTGAGSDVTEADSERKQRR